MGQKTLRIKKLYELVKQCKACPLVAGRPKFVFGEGSLCSPVMFIGEAPGKDEAITGRPFVGRSGRLLKKMIAAIELTDDSYIANICKCRPPNNRNPEKEEIETCVKYLKKQIEIINPKLLVFLGKTAVKGMCPKYRKFNMKELRMMNKGFDMKYEGIPVIVTYHPAALLYAAWRKDEAKEDFEFLQETYKKLKV